MNVKEVDVKYRGDQDGECLPIECICGHGKEYWSFSISIYDTDPTECPECGRKYFFKDLGVQVYLVEN